jgi:hypothetical protein
MNKKYNIGNYDHDLKRRATLIARQLNETCILNLSPITAALLRWPRKLMNELIYNIPFLMRINQTRPEGSHISTRTNDEQHHRQKRLKVEQGWLIYTDIA